MLIRYICIFNEIGETVIIFAIGTNAISFYTFSLSLFADGEALSSDLVVN